MPYTYIVHMYVISVSYGKGPVTQNDVITASRSITYGNWWGA